MEAKPTLKDNESAATLAVESNVEIPLLQKITTIENLLTEDLVTKQNMIDLRDQSIARLQEVVYEHEKRMFSNIDEGLLRQLCLYKDKLNQVHKRFAEASNTIIAELNFLSEEFDDLLYGLGVTTIEQDSLSYDRTTQKAKKHTPTDDSSLHNTVSEILKPGYITGSKILRKQEVSIYAHQKPLNNEQ